MDGQTSAVKTAIAGDKTEWTALDVLEMDNVPAKDRIWAVLRKDLIDASTLHEYACRCAENTLALIDNPDERSVAAIATKRAWLRGEATDDDLAAAWVDARFAARNAGRGAERSAAWAAVHAAQGGTKPGAVAWGTAQDAAGGAMWAAADAAKDAAVGVAAGAAAWDAQCRMLTQLIQQVIGDEV